MPLIQEQVVKINHWLTMAEFTDLITISQMTPGPIAINSATFVGIRIAGIEGAIVATLGCILPSFIIISALTIYYNRHSETPLIQSILEGLRPAVVALIASAGVSIITTAFWGIKGFSFDLHDIDGVAVLIFMSGLFVLRKYKLDPIYVMAGSGVAGMAIYLLR